MKRFINEEFKNILCLIVLQEYAFYTIINTYNDLTIIKLKPEIYLWHNKYI